MKLILPHVKAAVGVWPREAAIGKRGSPAKWLTGWHGRWAAENEPVSKALLATRETVRGITPSSCRGGAALGGARDEGRRGAVDPFKNANGMRNINEPVKHQRQQAPRPAL